MNRNIKVRGKLCRNLSDERDQQWTCERGSFDPLDVGALVTDHLLGHLETSRSELRCPHLLSAVAFPLARGFFGYRLDTDNLCGKHREEQ